jgi:adenylosuccinate lyase
MSHDIYETPLTSRYASQEMLELFGPQKKFSTWRRLWLALAKAERELGLPITTEQIAEMEAHLDDIDFEAARKYEKELRHDVMAHIHAFGDVCPQAKPILHWGATSCYVGDNTDLILMRQGLTLLSGSLRVVIGHLSSFAEEYKALPTLGFTHFQAAQLVTVGKRATLWISDFISDLGEIEHRIQTLALLGSKGTTGTQASFLELFDGDIEKVLKLDTLIATQMGFERVLPVASQTYSRKTDSQILDCLSGIAQSASKFANDIRLLSHLKEVEEPFETSQIGSSAMPYKRNPMRSERIVSLSRVVQAMVAVTAGTASNQWFERTLDDSAGKRISIPEAFLATDAILRTCASVANGLKVYPEVIKGHIAAELPFIASENILMRAVKAGGDRQDLHERIRVHSIEAGRAVKEFGRPNDLIERIAGDPAFHLSLEQLSSLLNPSLYIGCCQQQVEYFIKNVVSPAIQGQQRQIQPVEV